MQFERGGSVAAPGLKARLARIAAMLRAEGSGGAPDVAALRTELAEAAIAVDALEAFELKTMSRLSAGEAPGAESSSLKILATELSQRLTEIALAAAGAWAAPRQPHLVAAGGPTPGFSAPPDNQAAGPDYSWTVAAKYLNDRAGSIYAGTNEIQRNILAKASLGL
jgi:alkylation response protein AidB-like acyl-CoA dehydrogenase